MLITEALKRLTEKEKCVFVNHILLYLKGKTKVLKTFVFPFDATFLPFYLVMGTDILLPLLSPFFDVFVDVMNGNHLYRNIAHHRNVS